MEINTQKEKQLKEAIVRAVAYFDMFDFPLTANEIWQNLDIKCGLAEVIEALDGERQNPPDPLYQGGNMEEKNGFYFLQGRGDLVSIRQKRYNYADKKFKRALCIVKVFKTIPWLKMVAVTNIFGPHNLKKESDIDFFIVAETKRIWLVRFFCVGIVKLLGLRPKPGNLRDKICLNCYVSETALNLEKLMLPAIRLDVAESSNTADELPDVNFIYWLAGFVPIYNVGDTYERFIKANDWIKKYLPNRQAPSFFLRRDAGRGFSAFYHDVVDLLIGGLEVNVKNLQLKLMPPEMKSLMNKDTRVVVNDNILKLHVNDRRKEYRQLYKNKVQNLLLNVNG